MRPAVVAAMEVREQFPGIAGTVADKFVPVEGMEMVLEVALGDMARFNHLQRPSPPPRK